MKLLFSRFGVNRTLGSAILSIALLSAFLALAMSPRVTNTNLGSTGTSAPTPACTASAVFTGSFTMGQDASPAVVEQWEAFIESLTPSDYNTVTISGSNDTTGRTLTDATIVPQIATAMKNHTGGTWAAGGFVWSVGIGCSQADADPDAVELNANSIADGAHVCACPNPGYVVRPDIGPNNSSWGGVNTATCGGPSQTITVTFSGSGAPSCAPPPAGMISWWKGQGNTNDSQDDNNGTLKNGVTFAPAEVGQGFNLNGTDQYVEVPSSPNLEITGAISVDVWIKPNDVSSERAILSKYDNNNVSGRSWALGISAGGQIQWDVQDGTPGNYRSVTTPASIPQGVFTHVAGTFDPVTQDIKVYINGVDTLAPLDAGSATVNNIASNSTPLEIGWYFNFSGDYFSGIIDEVEIFDRAITGAEMLRIYNARCSGKCGCTAAPNGMVSWWRGENDTVDTADGNDGSFVGTPVYGVGEVGQAFFFNGSSYVSVPDATNLHFTTQFTLDAWVYPTDFSGAPIIFSKFGASNFTYELHLQSGGAVRSNISGDGTSYDSLISDLGVVSTNSWAHVTTTFNAGDWRIYVNGVQVVSKSSTVTSIYPGTSNLLIGSDTSNFFKGLIDEGEVFNRALTPTEVAALYNAGGAGKCRTCTSAPGGMISWWKAEANANDSEDNNNGTFNGTAAYSAGEVGQAFSFNNDPANYVFVPHNTNLDLTQFTVDAWVYPTGDSSNGYGSVVDKEASDGGINYALFVSNDGTVEIDFQPGDHQYVDSPPGAAPRNTWTHITGTYDGPTSKTLKLYINGLLVGTHVVGDRPEDKPSDATPPTGQDLFIGVRNGSTLQAPFNGRIDEVEVFGHALTDNEVRKIYDTGNKGKCPCTTPPNGMVSWWPADLNPFDYQDNNHGTLVGGAAYANGEVGEAFSFDGTSGHVSVPYSANQNIQNAITIDAWIMKKGNCTQNCIVFMKQNGVTGSTDSLRYGIVILSGTRQAGLSFNTGTWDDVVLSNTTIQDNIWYHLAGTYNGTTAKIYVNGVLDNSAAKTGMILPSTAGTIEIGHESGAGNEFFNGLIDEVELFNTALSADEIAAIYHAGGAGKCKPQRTPTPTPSPTATPTPGASPQEVTGAGTILGPNSGQASFRMQITNQKKKKKIQTIGSFSYSDPASGLSLSANKVAGLTFNGNQAHFTGTAKIGKRKASFSVDATDNGQPGTPNDIFSISISNGYSASGHLTSGDILFQQ